MGGKILECVELAPTLNEQFLHPVAARPHTSQINQERTQSASLIVFPAVVPHQHVKVITNIYTFLPPPRSQMALFVCYIYDDNTLARPSPRRRPRRYAPSRSRSLRRPASRRTRPFSRLQARSGPRRGRMPPHPSCRRYRSGVARQAPPPMGRRPLPHRTPLPRLFRTPPQAPLKQAPAGRRTTSPERPPSRAGCRIGALPPGC